MSIFSSINNVGGGRAMGRGAFGNGTNMRFIPAPMPELLAFPEPDYGGGGSAPAPAQGGAPPAQGTPTGEAPAPVPGMPAGIPAGAGGSGGIMNQIMQMFGGSGGFDIAKLMSLIGV